MQVTVTKEEAKEIVGGKIDRLKTGVEKLSKAVESEGWDDAGKILKGLSTLSKTIEANISEIGGASK